MINPQKALDWYKNKYPVISQNKSDYDLFEEIKNRYSTEEFPEENPFQVKVETPTPPQEELEEKNNPGFIEKVLTANLADSYAGDSDWWAEAYNKSLAGTVYEIKHCKPKYQVDDIKREWYDEAGQFFAGLMSPIDILTFFGSGGIGSIAAKKVATEPLKKLAINGLKKHLTTSTFNKVASNKFGRYLASSAAIESGVSLATYGAAGAALQDQAQQSYELRNDLRTERDYLQTTWAATKHGASSLALGSAAGYFTKGLMAPKYAKAKMSTDASFANKITKLTMNPVGQVVAEGSVFGTGQVAERALMGEDINIDDFVQSIFMNTGVVGGLRASTKILRLGQGDVERYKAAKEDFYGGVLDRKTGKYKGGVYSDIYNVKRESPVAKEHNSLKSIEKTYEEVGEVPPREVLDRIAKLETESEVSSVVYDTFNKDMKKYNELLTEFNAKDISQLPKDVQVKLLKEAGYINNVMYEFFSDMQTNRELGYQAYKKDFAKDKPLTEIQKKSIDKIVDNKVMEYKDVNEMLNSGALNETKALNKMKKVYGDGFEVSTRKITENNFEPVIKTPEGSEIKLGSYLKGIKTEKEAKEIASSLNDVYKKVVTGEDIAVNKALGIKEKNVEYIPIDAKTGKPQQKMSNLGPKYTKKRGAESEVNKLVEQGKAVKPKDIGLEPGIEIANQTSTKNILNEINEVAGEVSSSLKDKIKADKVEAERIADIEYKKMTPDAAFKTPEKFVNAVNRDVRITSKKYKIPSRKFIQTVAKEAGIANPEKFKLSIPKLEVKKEFPLTEKVQNVKDSRDIVESIKRDIRFEKDRLELEYKKGNIPSKSSGILENLQSQLKGASFKLFSLKKKLTPEELKSIEVPKDKNMKDLRDFFITLKEFKAGDYFKKKEALEKFNLAKKIEKKASWDKALTQDYQRKILKNVINVEDGNILNANKKQLKQYDEFLFNFDNIKQDGIEWNIISEVVKNQDFSDVKVKTMKDLPEKTLVLIKSQHEAINKLNAPEVSNILREHFSIFNNNLEGLNNFRFQAEKIIGKFKSKKMLDQGDYTIVSGKGEKYLSEKSYVGNTNLSAKDKTLLSRRLKFFEDAINPEWFQTVGKKGKAGDGLASKNKDGSYKYLNLNTKEGQIIEKYILNIQEGYGKDKFEQSIRRKLNKARADYIIKENDIKWVGKNEIYMPDILTKDGLNYVNEKNFKSLANKIATDMVQDKLAKGEKFDVNKKYDNKSGEEIWEASLNIARGTFDNYYSRGVTVGLSKHFKPKTYSYEPFIMNNKGKLVRAYEHSFDKTTKTQTRNMARDYATMEVAPDYLNLEGIQKKKVHNDIDINLKKRGVKKDNREWILDLADRQLGYSNKGGGYFDVLAKPVEGISRALSQTMLSLPAMPGIKAGLSGLSDALYIMRPMDMARGLVDVIRRDSNAYNKAVKSNVFDIGLKDYTKKQWGDLVTKNLFKLGGMEKADNFMRTWVVMSSKYHQQRQLEKIRNFPKNSKKYQQGIDVLRDFYFLTDKQISDAKKYSSPEKVLADNTLSTFEKAKKMRDIEIIEDKMNLYAHVNTQGSSSDLFMPKAATGKLIKPFLLFKRFAYASTSNLARNTKLSWKHKNPYKPIVGTTAKFVTGSIMFSLYWKMLGKPMPEENSDWAIRFKNTLWRGEFLGILGDFMNPYNDGFRKSLTEPFMPTVVSWMDSMSLGVGQLIEGKATKEQTFEYLLKKTVTAYGGYRNIIDRRNNPLNRDKLRIKDLYSQFEEEVLLKPNVEAERSKRTPYYIDLEKTFYLGTEEEYAKQLASTYIAIIHDEYRKTMDWNSAVKGAQTILKRKFTTMNPNKASLFKSSKKAKLNSLKFINWLQKHPEAGDLTKRLFEVEAEYKKRLALYNSKVPFYWKQLNFGEMLTGFDWKISL